MTINLNRHQPISGERKKKPLAFFGIVTLFIALAFGFEPIDRNGSKPNIIIFYVDDLGYGDLGCYGGQTVKTPFIDKLSKKAIVFTDAHSGAATCTPSRYSLLTGEHAFRNNAAILPGDAPLIIPAAKPTLPAMLKNAGYATAVVGKWHLGLGAGNVDWNGLITPGPREIGFNYSFLLPSTGDRVPSVYLENQKVVNGNPNDPITVSYTKKLKGYPNGLDSPMLLRQKADTQHSNTVINGISRIGYMSGGKDALWRDEDFPKVLSAKANQFIEGNSKSPFFLFFSFHDIHVPRVPNRKFAGKSGMGPRGDAIMQMDWAVMQVVAQLKKLKLLENTIIIFTSDNGPVLNDGYADKAAELVGAHKPGGPYRGGKYSAFEAGTRVPLIVSWPAKVKAQTSNALMSQLDFYRSLAAIVGETVPASAAIDSEDHSSALLGNTATGRSWMLEESYTFSARRGNWKYIMPVANNKNVPSFMASKGIENGLSKKAQLYNLGTDAGEKMNLADSLPNLVNEMQQFINTLTNPKKPAS